MIKMTLRILLTVIPCVFLVWFIAPMAFGVRNIGNALGIAICAAVIFRFGFAGVYDKLKLMMCSHTATTVLLRIVQIAASAFIVYAIIVSGFMVYAMNVRPSSNETAVVLGAQVKPWGASTLLMQRINAAEQYLTQKPSSKAVVTGGQGADEPMSEAQCMYDNLTVAGIEPSRILREDQAKNTEENIRFSFDIIKQNRLNQDVVIVTDSYHQLRARIIAHKTDKSVRVSAVNTHNNYIGLSAYPTYFVREWLAIPVELLK